MGSAGSRTSRAVLRGPVQLRFRAAAVSREVQKVVQSWFEDGAPLALGIEGFKQLLCPVSRQDAEVLFRLFDTDRNQKVDAFEILAANVVLGDGTQDEKLEALFPVFDFSGQARLNFDEVNIFMQSVSNGLSKACETTPMNDTELIEACRQLFDAHNLPYDRSITKEQLKRWLRSDIEAQRFVDSFHNACRLPELQATMQATAEAQAAIFQQLSGDAGFQSTVVYDQNTDVVLPPTVTPKVPVETLLQSHALRQALENPPMDAFRGFVGALMRPEDTASGRRVVRFDRFTKAAHAWSAFTAAGPDPGDEVDARDLPLLLWLYWGEEPTDEQVEKLRVAMGMAGPLGRVTRATWVVTCLREAFTPASSAPGSAPQSKPQSAHQQHSRSDSDVQLVPGPKGGYPDADTSSAFPAAPLAPETASEAALEAAPASAVEPA